jgi:hypothetical protein
VQVLAHLVDDLQSVGQGRTSMPRDFDSSPCRCRFSGATMLRANAACDADASFQQRVPQRGGGKQRRIVDRKEIDTRSSCQQDIAAHGQFARAGQPLDDNPARVFGYSACLVVNREVLDGGMEGEHTGLTGPPGWSGRESERVVIQGQRAHGRAVFPNRIVNGPAVGVGLPFVRGVVADNVAVDQTDTARGYRIGQRFDRSQRIGSCLVFLVR